MLTCDGYLMRLVGQEPNTSHRLLKVPRQVQYFATFGPKPLFWTVICRYDFLPKKNRLTSLASHIDEEPASLIARVRAAMPLIEANLRAGHSLRTVHQLLQQDGIAISYKLLALYRSRLRRGEMVASARKRAPETLLERTPSEDAEPTPFAQDAFDPAANLRKQIKKRPNFQYPSGPPDESKLF